MKGPRQVLALYNRPGSCRGHRTHCSLAAKNAVLVVVGTVQTGYGLIGSELRSKECRKARPRPTGSRMDGNVDRWVTMAYKHDQRAARQ